MSIVAACAMHAYRNSVCCQELYRRPELKLIFWLGHVGIGHVGVEHVGIRHDDIMSKDLPAPHSSEHIACTRSIALKRFVGCCALHLDGMPTLGSGPRMQTR